MVQQKKLIYILENVLKRSIDEIMYLKKLD